MRDPDLTGVDEAERDRREREIRQELRDHARQYVELAARTMAPPPEHDDTAAHLQMCVLGLVGELGELIKARDDLECARLWGIQGQTREEYDAELHRAEQQWLDELGDVYWYVAMFCKSAELFTFGDTPWGKGRTEGVAWPQVDIAYALRCASRLAEHVKKHVYHAKPLDREHLDKWMGHVLGALCAVAGREHLIQIWARNIEKLRERHPDGFRTGV